MDVGGSSGFNRQDLACTMVVLGLLLVLAAPMLGNNRADSARALCANNLRKAVGAVLIWGSDHGDLPPWHVPVAEGGTRRVRTASAWSEWAALSNQLVSPKVLACPADAPTPPADFFGSTPRGLAHPEARNNAVSYPVAIHGRIWEPDSIVSMDRNFRVSAVNRNCIYQINNAAEFTSADQNAGWTNIIHGTVGNVARADGTVRMMNSAEVRRASEAGLENNYGQHLLMIAK